jgi:tetratricopeptide (TPR) repeat protein
MTEGEPTPPALPSPSSSPPPSSRGAAGSPPLIRRRWFQIWVIASGLICTPLGLYLGWPKDIEKLPPLAPEEPAAHRRELIRAFADRSHQPPGGEDIDGIRRLFETCHEAVRAGDASAIAECYDPERHFQEIQRQADSHFVLPASQQRAYSKAVIGRLIGLVKGTGAWRTVIGYEPRSVRPLGDGGEAIVCSIHRMATGGGEKRRWWVIRRGGRWLIYDSEDVAVGLRDSMMLAAAESGPPDKAESRLADFERYTTGMLLLGAGDLDGAEQRLTKPLGESRPLRMKAVRLMMLAGVHLRRGDPPKALSLLDRAESTCPGVPLAMRLRAAAHATRGDPEQALAHVRQYESLLGSDAGLRTFAGISLLRLEKKREAIRAFRDALEDNGNYGSSVVGLAEALPLSGGAEVVERFARLSEPDRYFMDVCNRLAAKQDAHTLEAVIRAYEKARPAAPSIPASRGLLDAVRDARRTTKQPPADLLPGGR